ncbi:hypothetical protein [Pontiella sp.]|uniref:hypothetical protein n=1 Tax=Pontiella sp. TaxID=2837462 RepID=UPI003562024B
MDKPQWNPKDKAGSLQEWIGALNNEARRQFLLAGTHIELFFMFGDDGLQEVVPVVAMEKAEVIAAFKKLLAGRNGYAYIHIAEATVRRVDSGAESDSLLLIAESRDGLSEAWISTVVRRNEEKLLLDAVRISGSRLQGRFMGIFEEL